MSWTIGVDVGGTFTDFYAFNEETGQYHVGKTSSTPSNPEEAILEGMVALCEQFDIPLDNIKRVSHGTTFGTNALIQRTGSRVALITSEGWLVIRIGLREFFGPVFEDELQILFQIVGVQPCRLFYLINFLNRL